MRGDNPFMEGLAFAPAFPDKRLASQPYQSPIFERPATEYDDRNKRVLAGSVIKIRTSDVQYVPRKTAYSHIERRAYGGWGHVPETSKELIEERIRNEELRKGVDLRC